MSEWKLKRFWDEVSVASCDGGFAILLDGRGVKTPAKKALVVPTEALAEKVAAEWRAVDGAINPEEMPFTRSANAAIDKVSLQFAEVAEMIAEYAGSDLLCYRADSPEALAARQAAAWDDFLAWAAFEKGLCLKATAGVMPHAQSAEALAQARALTLAFTPFELTAFHDLVGLSGSFVLGLAAADGRNTTDHLWKTSRIDEDWQIEQWGADEEASQVAAIKKRQFAHAALFFALSQEA